jgi:hypothetical protein
LVISPHLHTFSHATSVRDDTHQVVDATPPTLPVTALGRLRCSAV